MNILRKLITNITSPKLLEEVKRSETLMKCYREENIFKSETIRELMSEKFRYKGPKPNTIYVKDLKTGEPVEATVKITREKNPGITGWTQEKYEIFDADENLIGEKIFTVVKDRTGYYSMRYGQMKNCKHNLGGVGFRLDQMQIERALELGISVIPRESLPKATLYHTKMGFLPTERKLVRINYQRQIKNFTEEEFKMRAKNVPSSAFEPVIVQKNGKFYLDVNRTMANTNLQLCKQILEKNKSYRVLSLDSGATEMALKGEELEHWKELLKDYNILSTLECAR